MDADGDFVVAWTSQYQDGSSTGVYAQRYDAAGLALGAEFRVNTLLFHITLRRNSVVVPACERQDTR